MITVKRSAEKKRIVPTFPSRECLPPVFRTPRAGQYRPPVGCHVEHAPTPRAATRPPRCVKSADHLRYLPARVASRWARRSTRIRGGGLPVPGERPGEHGPRRVRHRPGVRFPADHGLILRFPLPSLDCARLRPFSYRFRPSPATSRRWCPAGWVEILRPCSAMFFSSPTEIEWPQGPEVLVGRKRAPDRMGNASGFAERQDLAADSPPAGVRAVGIPGALS